MAFFVIKTTTTPSATNRLLTSLQMPQIGKTFELFCWLQTTRIAGDLSWCSNVVTLGFFFRGIREAWYRYSLRDARLLRGKFHSHVFDWLSFFAVVAGLRNLQKSKVNIWEAVIGCFL